MLKIYFLILLLLHFLILYFTRFTAWPEMFSYPYLIMNGFKPYQDIAFPYEPLLPLILSQVYQFLGLHLFILKIITWSTILFSDLLIFLISIKIIGRKMISLIPVSVYILIQPVSDGNMLWFDLATVPCLLLAFISFIFLRDFKKFLFLGLFLSLAFFIKQQAGITIAMLGFYFLVTRSFKNLIYYCAGFLIPTTLILMYILLNNLFNDYVFWTIAVPLKWYPSFPGYVHVPTPKEIFLIGIIFGSTIMTAAFRLRDKNPQLNVAVIIFLGSFLTAFPRFELFRIQPAIAFLIVLLCFIRSKGTLVLVILPVVVASLLLWKNIIPSLSLETRFYGQEDIQLADIIKKYNSSDELFLLGINSLQYSLTNKLPVKPWVDNYIWYMEIPGVQENVLSGLEQSNPKIIFRRSPELGNWFDLGVYQPKKIVDYINMNYNKTEVINQGIEIWIRKN